MSHKIAVTAEMFDGAQQYKDNYANGLMQSCKGVPGLESSGVYPFHNPCTEKGEGCDKGLDLVTVYELLNSDTEVVQFFFEDEYKKAFAAYREQLKTTQVYFVHLTAAIMGARRDAKTSWVEAFVNREYEERPCRMHWNDECKSWMF